MNTITHKPVFLHLKSSIIGMYRSGAKLPSISNRSGLHESDVINIITDHLKQDEINNPGQMKQFTAYKNRHELKS